MFSVASPEAAIERALEGVGLSARADARAGTLSRGLLQRLNVARAILHEPAVLVLDEPDTGLDVHGRDLLHRVIATQMARGASVVLTSHATEFALATASRVVVLERGVISAESPVTPGMARDIEASITVAAQRAST